MPFTTQNAKELTQEQVQKILVQPLEAESKFLSLNPTIFDTDGSPIRIPTLRGTFSPDWVGESELIPTEDGDIFGEVTLLPSTMKSVKSIVRFSNELARQSVIALDAALRSRLVKDVAAKLDRQFLSDEGDGITTPKGILAQEGIQVLPAAGGMSLDVLHDAQAAMLASEAGLDGAKWVMSSADFSTLRTLKDATGRYLVQDDVSRGAGFTLLGSSVVVTNHIVPGNALYADWKQVAVARDLNAKVTILKERYAEYDELALRVVSRYDLGTLNPEAVVNIQTGTSE